MKKHIIVLALSVLALSCSKDTVEDSSLTTEDPRMANSAITNIYATGDLAEQTPEEAKKIIFGKWDLGSSSSSAKSTSRTECSFESLEFTDESYIIKLSDSDSQSHQIYGTYDFEEVDDKVISVQLNTFIDGVSVQVAEITDIVVEENNGVLDIDFTFTFLFDLDNVFPCANNLNQNYSAEKDEPMEGTLEADEDSSHYKLVGKYLATNYSDSDGHTLSELYQESCIYYQDNFDSGEIIELVYDNCEPADAIQLELSTFGTYLYMEVTQNSPSYIEAGKWALSSDETSIIISDEEGYTFTTTIDELSSDGFTMSLIDDDEEPFTATFTWEKR